MSSVRPPQPQVSATPIAIRIATPDDAPLVRAILEDSYPALMATAYPAELLARAMPLITRPHPRLLAGGTYYLAEVDGEIAGCGGWSFWEPGGGAVETGLAHIRHFAVCESWSGRGVGRALYDRCESEARAAGADRFEVQSSLNGEAFYARLGFERIGPIDVPMGPDLVFPSILMRRSI
jgi:GNAT superfamily N-acetyltransferase